MHEAAKMRLAEWYHAMAPLRMHCPVRCVGGGDVASVRVESGLQASRLAECVWCMEWQCTPFAAALYRHHASRFFHMVH